MKYEKEVELFKEKKKIADKRILHARSLHAKRAYKERLKNGDWSIIVPEWDSDIMSDLWEKYEQAIIDDMNKRKIKGEIVIMEKRVSVKLSKDGHSVEVEYSGILDSEDFKELSLGALTEAKTLVQLTPTELKDKTEVKETKEFIKKDYEPKSSSYMKPRGKVTSNDITTKYLKGGQIGMAVSKINSGDLTLEQVNACDSWDESQCVVFGNCK